LNELQDNKLSSENWNFLLTRVKKNMILRSWINFNEALHLYVIRHEIDEYNFDCLERLNQLIIKICIKHADKKVKKISFDNVDKLSCTLLLSRNAQVMLMFNMFIKKSLINDLMSKLIVELSFKLRFWTRIKIESNCSHFQLNLSRIAHIFNSTRLNSTENWVNLT